MDYIIIDDEPDAIDVLNFHLNKIPFMELKATFRDPLDALEYLQKHTVDLLFLDINMPKLPGISFARFLEKPPLIIFTTAYSEYALESYELKAVDYLLKPIEFDRLLKAVMKAKEVLNQNKVGVTASPETFNDVSEQTIFIKSGSEFHQLLIQHIKYIESDGNYVTFHKAIYFSALQNIRSKRITPSALLYKNTSFLYCCNETYRNGQKTLCGDRWK
jgi:two-component system LytT family response regulator